MAGTTSIGGIVSGIQIEDMIAKLSEVSRRSITQYQTKQNNLRARQSAYQEANTRLLALREAAGKLALPSYFNARTASSDLEGVTATAQTGATPGEYQLQINTLARAHQMVSQSFLDVDTTRLGAGTFAVTAAGETTTLTLDDSNNTLASLRDAINAASETVRASIIQDGDASYRLMLSSKQTGTANALSVSVSLAGGTSPTMVNLQTAQDASVTLGEGGNAITVVRSTNQLRDLIPGVTLDLRAGAEGETATVQVGLDTEGVQTGVQAFVDQYNNVVDFLNAQFKYNSDTGRSGVLLGDYTLQGIQAEILEVFTGTVNGLTNAVNNLADLGITTGGEGKLTLDATVFQEQLQEDPDAVARVFALTGRTTNAGVQFLGAGNDTLADGTALAVNITQVALQARVTSGNNQTDPLGENETLTVNGVSIALTEGMTQTQVIAAINAHSATTRVIARATGADGTGTGTYLSFFASTFGADGSVEVVSTVSNKHKDASGVGDELATETDPGGEKNKGDGNVGQDVAGTINGEAATGTGQILVGNDDNATTEGLRLRISSALTGALGTVQVFGGAAHLATRTLDRITDTVNGPIQVERDSLSARIEDLQDIIDAREEAIKRAELQLRARFNSMEALMGQLQSQSSFLAAQLGASSSSQRSN